MPIFDSYVLKSSCDEMFNREKKVKEPWKEVAESLKSVGFETLQERQSEIDWLLEDNGVTYNVYNSIDGNTNRSWSLDPIPFVISELEWSEITKGLQQRAKLLNLILKDLYSEQKLIKENIIPAEVIFSHKGFSPEVYNFGLKENFNLYFYATDLARGPDEKMWVINDRTQAPSGLGYAIENRLTMNVIAKELYPNIETKKLFSFLEEFKNMFKKFKLNEDSVAALLTPGPYNETYFEHSYLSSFLNIELVQGEDLLTKNGSLWLKNLGGLKRVDTLIRRVDDRYCDPLELKNSSKLGVAGLVDVMRQDNLNMINPVGSAILENIGLNPFMEKASQYFLNETLILPQIATWWCGQEKELEFVLENLDKLIIKRIDRTESVQVYFCKKMSETEREELKSLLLQSPNQYVAQEEISFSTVPYYANNTIEPRSATIRTFSLKSDDEYSVMNGGLVRVSSIKDALLVSSQKGGTSKDLWILGKEEKEINFVNMFENAKYSDTLINNLSTLKAENLYWLGRYLSRLITTTRFVLHIVKKMTNFYRYEGMISKESQEILQKALTHLTMTYPGFFSDENRKKLERTPMIEISSVVKDGSRQGSLSFTFSMLSNTNINLKDILAIDSTKVYEKMKKEWSGFAKKTTHSNISMANELERMLIYMLAYKGLVKESIYKEQGLILYDIGYNIESALLFISKARSILCWHVEKSVEYDILEGLLNSVESFNAYRAKYKSSLLLENVIEFLIFNRQFPKSLAYRTEELMRALKLLPKSKDSLSSYEKPMAEANLLLQSLNIKEMMKRNDNETLYFEFNTALSKLSELYIACSDEFSKTYFSHYDE
ncbi:MAG: circularly permuted type 2 ATP-grasp protein [Campylobacterales bacterium]|nr:circularly permuted type 2 ATP-grasp protein [Campylobacterales bacterium]